MSLTACRYTWFAIGPVYFCWFLSEHYRKGLDICIKRNETGADLEVSAWRFYMIMPWFN